MTHAHEPRIAYQGERGAFSELAILRLCGESVHTVPCEQFGDVTHVVLAGVADFGLLPVHNSIAGVVQQSVEAIAEAGLHIVLASEMPIRLCLLAVPGATLETLRSVESHPVALRQCARFLAEHSRLIARAVDDTAGAARLVSASGDATRAAVASSRASSVYGLQVLRAGIEDRADNVTRFVLVSRDAKAELAIRGVRGETINLG